MTLNGDALLISQALTNLLDNAIDFTPPGGCVSVRGERRNSITASAFATTAAAFLTMRSIRCSSAFIRCRAPNGQKAAGWG